MGTLACSHFLFSCCHFIFIIMFLFLVRYCFCITSLYPFIFRIGTISFISSKFTFFPPPTTTSVSLFSLHYIFFFISPFISPYSSLLPLLIFFPVSFLVLLVSSLDPSEFVFLFSFLPPCLLCGFYHITASYM